MRVSTLLVSFVFAALIPAVAFAAPPPAHANASKPARSHAMPHRAHTQPMARQHAAREAAVIEGRVNRPVTLVGWVNAGGDKAHRAAALETMRRKAGALGADAVVNIEFHGARGEVGHYTGVAVRFKPEPPKPHAKPVKTWGTGK
jgi:hypothetical protein